MADRERVRMSAGALLAIRRVTGTPRASAFALLLKTSSRTHFGEQPKALPIPKHINLEPADS
jgi:hypothetical protein